MARTLSFLLLVAAVGCQTGGNGRDTGPAPPRFAPFRPFRSSEPADASRPVYEQDRLDGRNPVGRYSELDPQEKHRGLAERAGPTGR